MMTTTYRLAKTLTAGLIWLLWTIVGSSEAAAMLVAVDATGTIIGRVTDAETGEPLPGANLLIKNTLLGTSSDSRGNYQIHQVPSGKHILRISFVGYGSKEVEVLIASGARHTADFSLKTSVITFDQVVVTGSRQAEELQAAANSVSVLTSADVIRRDNFRIDQTLQTIPGVELVGENVSVRGGAGFSLLGLGGSRVLMLIDEVPVLTSDLGRANWDILPVTELERVEVLKGAASVFYGSGGISGVVNVITKRPTDKPRIGFRQSLGMYTSPSVPEWKWTDKTLHYYRTDLSVSDTFGPVGLRLAVSRHHSTSDRQNAEFDRWYFTAKPVIYFGDGSNLTLFGTYSTDDRGFFLQWRDQNHALSSNFNDRINVDGLAASAIYNKLLSSTLSMKARFSFNSQVIGLPFGLTQDFEPALGWTGDLQVHWLPTEPHNLTAGLEYRRDLVESKYYGAHQAASFSPYLQETWRISDRFQLSAGMRYDTYVLVGDSTETQFSPKIGASYRPYSETILHASFGRGFRSPSIAERFSESNPDDLVHLIANPGLRPERSYLFDFGIRQRIADNFSVELTAFRNEYDELIELTQVSDQRLEFQFRNCPRARISGLESDVSYRFWRERIGLRGNLTWLRSLSLGSDEFCKVVEGEPLPYRPEWSWFLSVSGALGPFGIEAEYRYVSRFETVAFFPLDERVPQKVLDVRTSYRWKNLRLMLQANNLINYNYTIIERNLGDIRNISVALSGEF